MANLSTAITALTHLAQGIGYLLDSGSNDNADVQSEAREAGSGRRSESCCNGERAGQQAEPYRRGQRNGQRSHRVMPFVPKKGR